MPQLPVSPEDAPPPMVAATSPVGVDRNIRPRRFAILLVILVGFIGGVLLVVWWFVRQPGSLLGSPGATDSLFASPAATETPLGSLPPFIERDSDGDGLTDAEETQRGTDLSRADTDGDGYTDKQEVDAGYDPLGPGKLDTDRDGLADPDEQCWRTDPRNPDTDGDGYLDGQEVINGFDPRVPSPADKLSGPSPCR